MLSTLSTNNWGQLNNGYWQDIAGSNTVVGEKPFQGRAEILPLLNSAETEISSTLKGLGVPTAYVFKILLTALLFLY